MHARAAEFFRGHGFVGDGLHDLRPGHEHVARVFDHEDEVGHRRRINVAARARAHDDGNLRDHAGRDHIAPEHFAIAAERRDAFLNARAARVEQADDRRAGLQRHVLDLGDLLRMRFRERAAEHGEVFREHEDLPAVHRAPAGDDAVARHLLLLHAEVAAAVLDESIEFLERALVEQEVDALARGQLAALVLRDDARLAAAELGFRTAVFQRFENFFHRLPLSTHRTASAARFPVEGHGPSIYTRTQARTNKGMGKAMKVCIYGAGAIGGYIGVLLKLAGADVSLIARGAHLEAIKKNGLLLKIGGEEKHAAIRATHDPAELDPQDYVICALKAHQAWEVADKMPLLFGPDTAVVTAQNGLPWWYFYGFEGQYANRRIESGRSRRPPMAGDRPRARDRLHGLSGGRNRSARRHQTYRRRQIRSGRADAQDHRARARISPR